jgi:hypothetical protein
MSKALECGEEEQTVRILPSLRTAVCLSLCTRCLRLNRASETTAVRGKQGGLTSMDSLSLSQ